MKNIYFTFGKYDFTLHFRANRKWSDFKVFRNWYSKHIVWGRFSLLIEDWTAEVYRICKACDSDDVHEVHIHDEGFTVCNSCRSVEQGTYYLNKREYEEKFE